MNQDINYALRLFEKGDYKSCVEAMIECFNTGIERDWIKEFFYSNFISPNEEEYKASFEAVNHTGVEYEECMIDFIPISDFEFFLFDKQENIFCGNIVIDNIDGYLTQFESVFFSGFWDIRILLGDAKEKIFRKYYTVVNDDLKRLVSFFKIPLLKELCTRMTVFKSEEEFCAFFIGNNNEYIPKMIISYDSEHVYELIDNIHLERLKNTGDVRNNIFLSICIPSYNRGHRALELVKEIMSLPYDSEIEIIVSDNGSTKNVEGYEEIESMSKKDSRIIYDRIPENAGYFENICNVFSLANGKFILAISDEDHINLPSFEQYIEFLYRHPDLGVGIFSGTGSNLNETDNACIEDKIQRCLLSMSHNYVSGLTINNEALKQEGAIDIVRRLKNNRFVSLYTHCALAAIVAKSNKVYTSEILLINAGKEEASNESDTNNKHALSAYMYPDDRIRQLRGIMDFTADGLRLELEEYLCVMFCRLDETYRYMRVLFSFHGAIVSKEISWDSALRTIYHGVKEYLNENRGIIPEHAIEVIHKKNEDCFFATYKLNPIGNYIDSEDEKSEFEITYLLMKYLHDKGKAIDDIDYYGIRDRWKKAISEGDLYCEDGIACGWIWNKN